MIKGKGKFMNAPGSFYNDHSNESGGKCGKTSPAVTYVLRQERWYCTRPKGHYGYHEALIISSGKYLVTWTDNGIILGKPYSTFNIKERWNNLPSITRQKFLDQIGVQRYDEFGNEWDDLSVIVQIKILRDIKSFRLQ